MIVVAIIGVLAALAIYGVSKYLANAKTAEARTALGRISKDAAAAWERENMDSTPLALGSSIEAARSLCPTATLVPTALTSVTNAKYQSAPSDWNTTGWKCLRFSMDGPQYFQYMYTQTGDAGAEGGGFSATANGAGNSLGGFSMTGEIKADTAGNLAVAVSPSINETDIAAGGGDTAGGDTAGGDTAGGDTAGGDTAGGDTAGTTT